MVEEDRLAVAREDGVHGVEHRERAGAGGDVAESRAGPAVGGWLLAKSGATTNFLVNALAFSAVVIVLYRWREAPRKSVLPAERFSGGAACATHRKIGTIMNQRILIGVC